LSIDGGTAKVPYVDSTGAHTAISGKGKVGYFFLLHELGHALGLRGDNEIGGQSWNSVRYTVMSYKYDANDPLPTQPMIIDILAVYIALPTVVLVAVHYLLVIRFDTSLVWLRTASIVLPAIFGLVLDRRAQPRWYLTLALGIVVALVSVLGMSTMVHFTDGDPILPKGGVAWRETLEYVTSISLAYLLGSMIARALRPLGAKGAKATGRIAELATFFARHMSGGRKARTLEERVQRMIKLIRLVISISTALGAIYTGFKSIL